MHRPPVPILLAAVLAFGVSLSGPFHLDDHTLFEEPAVTSPAGWLSVWHPLQTRPLTYFTFWVNYQLGGRNPAGYHAVNIALHLCAIWLLYGVLTRLIDQRAATIAATVFAVHPIQAEPVNYIFARAIILATIFCLLSMRSWIEGRYWAAAAWFTLALLGKEECAAFPLILLLIRPALLPAAGMLCLSLAAGARVLFAIEALQVTGAGATAGISPAAYFTTQGLVILRYLRLLLVPYGFTFDPDIGIVSEWRGWLAWSALAGAAICLWRWRSFGKWFAAGLLLLAPSSTIFPAQDLAADRRMYLPMVAFSMLAGLLLTQKLKRPVLISMAAVLIAFSFVRTLVWRSELTLWSEAVRRSPKKLRPRLLLARASSLEAALVILEEAQAIAPHDPNPALDKGIRWMEARRPELALPEFERAVALAPHDPKMINNRGVARLELGQREAAIEDFRRALQLDPCWSSARANLELLGASSPARCE